MTNKKFKVAAMSMALTACVAAQPLIANAADDVNAVSNDAPDSAPQSEGESTASAPVAAASVSSDPVTNQKSEGAVDVIGDPDISVDYNHDNDKVTKDDSSTTTESTGPVNRDVPKESEPGAQQPSGDGQQPSGDGQQDGNHETDLNNEQKGEPETDLNNEQKGEPETDLNNEQEGPKDGGSETEKKPIGEAEKSETETKDTELVLGKPNTTTTTTTNPDGSTTTTTTTTTDAALETTTKVEGEASAKTEEDSSEDVKKNLKEELQGGELSWDTETKTKFGDYTVTDAVVKDGKKEFTLTKEDKIETGEMTGLDISKLIEAGYTDNGDGTYTLTKEYTDSQGQKQTTTVKVDSSTATKTTKTTLTVTMASQKQEKTEDLGTKEDKNYPYTNVTVKDNKGKEHTFNVKDILDNAHDKGDGTLIYEDKENNLTYTITKNETDTNLDNLTDTQLRDLLNQNTTGNRYSVDAAGNLCYTTDQGEVCRVTNEQNTLLRSMLKLGITITDHHGKESDTQKVENSDKTPEQAKADAKKAAQEDALKDALAQAINKETGKNLTKADIDLSKAKDGKFEWTDSTTSKTYTFSYTEKGTVSSSEKINDPTTVKPDASSAEKNTETGSAEVTGSTVIWTDKDQTFIQNDSKTETAFGKDFDFRSVPGGFELDGEAELNEDGTLKSFKTKDGKTYEFTYEKGSAPDTLTDISNADFTKVTWKMTEKKIGSATSPDTSEPTHIEIERNFRKKTEDNGTFTFTETKEGGKTYSGLKKVAGEGNVYSNDDGTVTITVTTSELGVGVNEIKAALEGKGYTDVKVNPDGTASYKDGNVTYNVTYNTTVESITVKTKEVVKESSSTISVSDSNEQEAKKALEDKIAELQAGLEEGEYIEVNGERFDRHTEVETIIRAFTTAMNYKNMSDADIVAMLKKQKEDADKEGKSYTGAGVKHNWDGSHSTTGSNPNYIGHLDLATDSDLKLKDGTTADAILLNTGDKKFKFEWNMDAEALVNKDKPDTQAKFSDSISYDEGKMNDGSGTGDLAHYEYERKYTGSWIAPDSNNYPHESAYYRLTGTIAYNSLEDGKEYGTRKAAEKALDKWRAEHPDAEDYKPNIVALSKKNKQGKKITVYKAYTYESSLTAYGYMSKDSNTCVNIGYGKDEYGRPKWAGGFDLRISGLTQVTKTESSAHGKNYYDYYADITKYKTVEQTSRPLANRLLDVKPGTKTEPTETTNTDTGSGLFGSYDQNHREDHNYEKPFTGAGTAEYTTYRTWADTTADWDGKYEKLSGAFGFNYTTTKDAKVTDASKKTCVKTDSSVKYHYSYVERQELDPITETKTVTTPDDDDGDGGDKIIEEKDHDSPVLPGTPELPPVQDAKPDAPVLPADPALPAVQDAHALPQTGVNWLAAIGLALSGMTLMITGAFASLTGKNAKH